MRSSIIATILALAGCLSSRQLNEQANIHMSQARAAAAVGNYEVARAEQRKGEYDYQRAVSRARDESRLPPPPPANPPLPVFDPQMQR
jgi:hypothetical protein